MRGVVRDQARSVVRVIDAAGVPVGAGFLIGPDLVATCAHVVAAAVDTALGDADPYAGAAPAGLVRVDLPLVHDAGTGAVAGPLPARVHHWSPIAEDGTGDIAVLRLERPVPDGARMPPLRRVDELWDHGFRVLGFPDGLADGVWATGRIRGEQGTRWCQLQGAPGDQAIAPGFSGSPVWDDETGAVVGMTVAADRSADTTTAYLIPIDQVLGIDPELLPCPYRGLEPFGEEHTAFFFGRDPDLARLEDAVAAQPLVAVAGPSGVGKSSLVRAGLLPRRRDEGERIAELRASVGTDPAAALAAALVPVLQQDPSPDDLAAATAEAAAHLGSPDAAVREATTKALAAGAPDVGVLLFVDQFEELAATEPTAARELLLLLVDLVHHRRVRAVLTVRWESLTELMAPEGAEPLGGSLDSVLDAGSTLVAGTVLVGPLDRTRLRDAVVGPAERAPGLSFEAGLVERILDDAGAEPGQLPLVESLLTELWERRTGGYLTIAAYEAAGGVAGAVAKRAEELLAEFPDPNERDRLRRLLTLLAQPDREGRFVRRPVSMAELPTDLRDLVPRLVAGRLLVVQRHPTGAEMLELAHQALIEHWPRLRGWLTEDRDFLAWRAQLDQQRERWIEADQDPGALLRGTALAAAQHWLPARTAELSPPAHDYLNRSRARQRREVGRWRMVTAVLAVLVVAAGALTAVVFQRGDELADRLRIANAENLAGEAERRAQTDPDLAARLALAAWRADPANPRARSMLASQYLAGQSLTSVHPAPTTGPIAAFTTSTDGEVLAFRGGDGGIVVITGAASGAGEPWPVPQTGAVPRFVLSPDGRQLMTASADGGIRLWDVASRTATDLAPLPPDADPTTFAASPDLRRLAWLTQPSASGRRLVLFDVAARTAVPHGIGTIGAGGPIYVRLTEDPAAVVLYFGEPDDLDGLQADRQVLVSVANGAELQVLPAAATLADGRIVTCQPAADPTGLATVVVSRPVSATELLRTPLLSNECHRLQQSADGRYLIEQRTQPFFRRVTTVRLLRLSDGATFDAALPPEQRAPTTPDQIARSATVAVAETDGGTSVIQASGTTFMRIAATRQPLRPNGEAGVQLQRLTPDGRLIVSVDAEGYQIYDRASGRMLGQLPGAALRYPGQTWSSVDAGGLNLTINTPSGWVLDRYSLPEFDLVESYALPSSTADPALRDKPLVALDGDRVIALVDSQLSVWDRRTGTKASGPFPVALPASMGAAPLRVRPGHLDEVAIISANFRVTLWNVATGQQLGGLEPPPDRAALIGDFAFDRSGERLAGLSVTGAGTGIDVWDVDDRGLLRPTIPVPYTATAVGFDADGYLVLFSRLAEPVGFRVAFWDVTAGREAGSLDLSTHIPEGMAEDGRAVHLSSVGAAVPGALALTAQQWRDHLCRFADRPFAEHERDALPLGFDTGSPCS